MGDMDGRRRRDWGVRAFLYLLGLVILAVGITLNTKATLGVSPIISVAYCVSQIGGWDLGDVTFLWYSAFVLAEMAMHAVRHVRGRQFAADGAQILVSLIFTRFMDLFAAVIPVFETAWPDAFPGSVAGRFLILLLAIVLTGVGADLSLSMRIVPNPGDGLVQGISDLTGIRTGTAKNLVDLSCVLLTVCVSMVSVRRTIGIGIGTLAAVVGVGRVVAVFERLFGARMRALVARSSPSLTGRDPIHG